MSPAHLVPALFVAVIIIWIGTSVIYQDYAPSAKKYLDDRGLSVEMYPAAAPGVVNAETQTHVDNGVGAEDEVVLGEGFGNHDGGGDWVGNGVASRTSHGA